MNLYPVQRSLSNRWKVVVDSRLVALIYMDYYEQVHKVVLMPQASPEDELAVLRLAASHVSLYLVHRSYSNGLLNVSYHQEERSSERSSSLMQNKVLVPEIELMDREKILAGLRGAHIEVTKARVSRFERAIRLALKGLPVQFNIELFNDLSSESLVTFWVSSPSQFRAWKSVGAGGTSLDLYIVPDYHPDRNRNKEGHFLVNGATDALITGQAIRSVFAPHNFGERKVEGFSFSSWNHPTHPFYVAGSQVKMLIYPSRALSAEGIEEIRSVILALLETGDTYLSVSGGFLSPLDHPSNVVHRLGKEFHDLREEARGSEGFCVWSYQVLRDEGALDRAYIPPWFRFEGWLEAYGVRP